MQILEIAEKGIQLGKETAEKKIHILKEMVKIKNEIAICKEITERNYREIGKAYYETHQHEMEDLYGKQMRAIKNAENGAADLEQKEKLLKENLI